MKRMISLLLALVMLLGNIPAVVFATEEVTESVAETEAVATEETTAPTQPAVPEETSAPTEETVPATEFVEEIVAPTETTESSEVTVTDEAVMAVTVVASGTCGDNLTWKLDAEGTLTISGTGDMKRFPWDETPWQANCNQIKTVIIKDGVTSIGDYAFNRCSNLTAIDIPDSVVDIRYGVFYGCSSLTNMNFPSGVTSVASSLFEGCSSLKRITIPAGVTAIGSFAFQNCSSLKEITFEGNAPDEIGETAFLNVNATAYYPAGDSTWTSGKKQNYCGTITWVSMSGMDDNLPSSGSCGKNLTWVLDADGILTISGTGAMPDYTYDSSPWRKYADSIKAVVIEQGVTAIGTSAFTECLNLESVSIPATVKSIGNQAFAACLALKRATMAEGVISIGDYVFTSCGSLTKITIPDSVETIGAAAFLCCSSLTEITLPQKLRSIPDFLFMDCRKLNNVTIPNSVVSIGQEAFRWCEGITQIIIPARVTKIGLHAFTLCTGLKKVDFKGNAPSIDETAFTEVAATASYPGGNYTWKTSVLKNYGGTLTWQADIPTEPPCMLADLDPIDYMAFSELAYHGFVVGETVFEALSRLKLWSSVWGLDNITYGELCRGIAGWKVLSTRNLSIKNGFYAVAFCNDSNEVLIAYRGSVPLDEVNADNGLDAAWDWLVSDLRMQVLNVLADETQSKNAFRFYEDIRGSAAWNRIDVTGHSLGGGLANMVSARYGCKGVTMNAISILDALYEAMPAEMGELFYGVDSWKFMDHANMYDVVAGMWEHYIAGDKLKPVTIHKSNLSLDEFLSCHGMRSYVIRDANGDPVMQNVNSTFIRSETYSKSLDALRHVNLGTTGADTFSNGLGESNLEVTYGGKGNDIIHAATGADVLIGGKGGDTLDGGWGDDFYIYYKGDGVDTIKDTSGDDTLYLRGFSDSDTISAVVESANSKYIYICCNDEIIAMIHRDGRAYTFSTTDSLKVSVMRENGSIEIKDITNSFKRKAYGSRILVSCPVSIEILDVEGNVVYTLLDGEVSTHYTEFGNFYVFEEADGGYGKSLELVEGYTARIVGEDTGTMEIEHQTIENGVLAETTKRFENVPVTNQLVAEFEVTDNSELVLAADTDGDNVVDTKIGYDGKPVPVEAIHTTQEYIVLKPGESFTLQAEVKPVELTQLISWSVEKGGENIIDVAQDGTVTGKNVGTAYVLVTVESGDTSITERCRVDVAQAESDAEPSEPDEEPAKKVEINGIQLSTDKVTTELYKDEFATFEILLDLPQNRPFTGDELVVTDDAAMSASGLENKSNLIESVQFKTISDLFELVLLDDRTVQIVPTQKAMESGKTLKSSYTDTVIVKIKGEEEPREEELKLTLTVKKTLPKPKAKINAFNSFYEGQSQEIVITGVAVTGIRVNENVATPIPNWLTLEDGRLTLNGNTPKSSDKAYLWVDVDGFRYPVELTLTVKHSKKAPTLKFAKSSVTLNKAAEQLIEVAVTSSDATYAIEDTEIRITGGKTGELEAFYDNGMLIVTTTEKTPDMGTYKVYIKTPGCKEVAVTVKVTKQEPSVSYKAATLDLSFPETAGIVVPTFKNYSGGFEIEDMTAKTTKGENVDFFQAEKDGKNILVTCDEDTPTGSYNLDVELKLDDGQTINGTAKVNVKRTAVKLKLSSTKVSLNKDLPDQAVVEVSCTTKNYKFDLDDAVLTYDDKMLDIERAGNALIITLADGAEYGKTYPISVSAYEGAPAVKLNVAVLKKGSVVKSTIKATGTLDVIREGTAITVKPTYTNYMNVDVDTDAVLKIYSSKDNYKTAIAEVKAENGIFTIDSSVISNHVLKYKAELETKVGGKIIKSNQISLSVKMGAAKLTTGSSGTTMFAKDRNDRALVWFEVADLTLNDVASIEIKDAKYKDAFEIIDYRDGSFAIAFKDGKIHESIAKQLEKKSSVSITLNLNVFIEGNETVDPAISKTAKANTTQKVKLTIVK